MLQKEQFQRLVVIRCCDRGVRASLLKVSWQGEMQLLTASLSRLTLWSL